MASAGQRFRSIVPWPDREISEPYARFRPVIRGVEILEPCRPGKASSRGDTRPRRAGEPGEMGWIAVLETSSRVVLLELVVGPRRAIAKPRNVLEPGEFNVAGRAVSLDRKSVV